MGGVFQPDYLPGFALTIDYYKIRLTDAITTPRSGTPWTRVSTRPSTRV
ncbi:hypothetical protein E6W36_09095 [Hankyongella ginsenosidimutans]|uniref:Uncharacterized protein n=1 Tax=Hankyongella ginsenosidimutans TaxID=1763828 RepID=A0A4D7BYZ5_9SPHN|nr:hypothetical protein E6W36_09095 [Hankyongella ginsenosidimutans]